MDDALITLRYSVNFGTLGLPIWNKADIYHPTMGFTSPLWMLINSIQAFFTDNKDTIVTVAKFWSFSFLIGFTWLIVSVINKAKTQLSTKVLFTILLLWNPVFAFHASSGMETILFGFAMSLFVLLVIRFTVPYWAMILFGLVLFFIRPEGILVLAIYWGFNLFHTKDFKKASISALFISVVVLSYGYLVYNFFGYPLPSAFYVKQGGEHIFKLSAIKMASVFILLSALPLLLFILGIKKKAHFKQESFLYIVLVTYFTFYLTVEPLMNIVYRYQMPILFLLTLTLATHIQYFNRLGRLFKSTILTLFILLIIFNSGLTGKYTSKVEQADYNLRAIGLFFKNYRNDSDWLMYHDAGIVCYYSDLNSIDSMGLNTIDLAVKKKSIAQYIKDTKVKYYLQNDKTNDLNQIDTNNISLKYGFSYLAAVPISYDGKEYYVVKIYQRDGKLTPSDLKSIKTNLQLRTTWFDSLYYMGRKLIKNR